MLRLTLILALVLLTRPAAAATSGWVYGYLQFYQNQWGYCTSNCTGWKYLSGDFQHDEPLAEVTVYIYDDLGNQIGTGNTNAAGYYNIYWYSSLNRTVGQLRHMGHHKDGRFRLRDENNLSYWFTSTNGGLVNGGSVNWGVLTWGTPANPHPLMNVYDGAWRTWYFAMGYSSSLNTYLFNVNVKCFDTDDSCPSSCATGLDIELDDNPDTYRRYGDRIAHELGHVASTRSSVNQFSHACAAYNYPTNLSKTGGSWNLTTAEWGCTSWEEGYATFIGDVSRHWWDATNPKTMNVSGSYALEYNADTDGCVTDEGRRALSVNRFLWDMYDLNSDDSDTVNEFYGDLIDRNAMWAVGTANRKRDEAHNGTGSGAAVVDGDGKSLYDYHWNYWDNYGVSTYEIWLNQCSPTGD